MYIYVFIIHIYIYIYIYIHTCIYTYTYVADEAHRLEVPQRPAGGAARRATYCALIYTMCMINHSISITIL